MTKKKVTTAKAKPTKAAKATKVAKKSSKVSSDDLPSVHKIAKKATKVRSKMDVTSILAESTGLTKKQVALLFTNLSDLISFDMTSSGPGVFNIPGLLKIKKVHKAAAKARKGINPFTKEPTVFKAKPAKNVVRIRPLKALKDKVN